MPSRVSLTKPLKSSVYKSVYFWLTLYLMWYLPFPSPYIYYTMTLSLPKHQLNRPTDQDKNIFINYLSTGFDWTSGRIWNLLKVINFMRNGSRYSQLSGQSERSERRSESCEYRDPFRKKFITFSKFHIRPRVLSKPVDR